MKKQKNVTDSLNTETNDNISEEKIDKDLDYFRSLYPETDEKLVCRLYRYLINEFKKEKRTFLDEFNYVPNEKEIAEKFGGGDFELYLMHREGIKGGVILKAKAKFSIDKVWTRSENGKIQEPESLKQGQASLKDKLEELKMMKDVMISGDNNGNNAAINMMLSMQSTLMSVLVEMIKNTGKSDNKVFETILPTLLNKSLEKQNILSDIETISKLKEVFPSSEGGTDWGNIIGNTLPLLIPMLSQNGKPEKHNLQQRAISPVMIDKKLLKESVKEAIEEFNSELENNNEAEDKTENTDSETKITELNSFNQIDENNMNIQSQIKLIKNSPIPAQDQILKMWCGLKPVKEVMEFCINTGLIENKEEFIKRAEKLEINVSDIK